jgi:hypothetical protein
MRMSQALYFECWSEAGEWAGPFVDHSVALTLVLQRKRWAAVSTAVYLAADDVGEIVYVGSVKRVGLSGLSERMKGHGSSKRFGDWESLYIVPLLTGTPEPAVRGIEGRIGRRLNPAGNVRLPRG